MFVYPKQTGGWTAEMEPADGGEDLGRASLPEDRIDQALGRLVRWSLRQDITDHILGRAGGGLTISDAWALGWVVERGPIRPTALARQLCIEPSTLVARIHTLTAAGLVETRADPEDRRAKLLAATVAGYRVYAALHDARRDLLVDVLHDLPKRDVSVLARALTQLADLLEAQRWHPLA